MYVYRYTYSSVEDSTCLHDEVDDGVSCKWEMGILNRAVRTKIARVATAQGKQGIWLLTFPDRENTGNLVNLIFYTGKIVPTQGKF